MRRSIRGSGTIQMAATKRYSSTDTPGQKGDSTIAVA